MFKRAKMDDRINWSGRESFLDIAPAALRKAFGEPEKLDGYKVSGEYMFEDDDGNIFTVYDYKSTSMYDRDLESPEQFWSCEKPRYFSIGGHRGQGDFDAFRTWLLETCK